MLELARRVSNGGQAELVPLLIKPADSTGRDGTIYDPHEIELWYASLPKHWWEIEKPKRGRW